MFRQEMAAQASFLFEHERTEGFFPADDRQIGLIHIVPCCRDRSTARATDAATSESTGRPSGPDTRRREADVWSHRARTAFGEHAQHDASVSHAPGEGTRTAERAHGGEAAFINAGAEGRLEPTRPVNAAGMRIQPPPSAPRAAVTISAATDAAAPPLDPPGVRSVSRDCGIPRRACSPWSPIGRTRPCWSCRRRLRRPRQPPDRAGIVLGDMRSIDQRAARGHGAGHVERVLDRNGDAGKRSRGPAAIGPRRLQRPGDPRDPEAKG